MNPQQMMQMMQMMKPVPDGGWGWVIAVGSSIVFSMCVSLTQSLSPMLLTIQRYFRVSSTAVSGIFSLLLLLMFLTGNIGVAISRIRSHRSAVLIGGVLSSAGYFISSFAPSIAVLYLTLGVLVGIGYGIAFGSALAIFNVYFRKKLPKAMTIALVIAGLLHVVFPPLLSLIVLKYGWKGSFLIIAALNANICVSAALYRTPANKGPPLMGPPPPHVMAAMMGGQMPPGMMGGQMPPGMMGGQRPPGMMGGQRPPGMMGGQRPPGMMGGQRPPGPMAVQSPPGMMLGQRPPGPSQGQRSPGAIGQPGMAAGQRPPGPMNEQRPQGVIGGQGSQNVGRGQGPPGVMPGQRPPGPMDGQRPPGVIGSQSASGPTGGQGPSGMMGGQGSPGMMGGQGSPGMMGGQGPPGMMGGQGPPGMMGGQGPPGMMGGQGPPGMMGGPAMGMMGGGPPMKKPPPHVMILKLFNFPLFCQCPLLLLVSIVGCLFSMLFYGSILHMMPRALSINPRSGLKAVILVSIIGISTLIGRILQGVLMKRQIGKPMKVIGVSSFISGVLSLIFPLGNFYPGLVACCFVFGVCNGLIQGFTLAFLREAVGLLNLMTARALFMIWYGIGGCLGPLIAGLAYDHSGSHMMSFCILGGCSVLGAVLCLLTPRVAMKQKQITETIQQKMQAAMRERMANAERPTPPVREDENTVVDACISSV